MKQTQRIYCTGSGTRGGDFTWSDGTIDAGTNHPYRVCQTCGKTLVSTRKGIIPKHVA